MSGLSGKKSGNVFWKGVGGVSFKSPIVLKTVFCEISGEKPTYSEGMLPERYLSQTQVCGEQAFGIPVKTSLGTPTAHSTEPPVKILVPFLTSASC